MNVPISSLDGVQILIDYLDLFCELQTELGSPYECRDQIPSMPDWWRRLRDTMGLSDDDVIDIYKGNHLFQVDGETVYIEPSF